SLVLASRYSLIGRTTCSQMFQYSNKDSTPHFVLTPLCRANVTSIDGLHHNYQGAVVGSRVGRLHWPGSKRTLEGSASVFVTTLGSLLLVARVLAWREGQEKDGVARVEWGAMAASLAWPVALTTLMEAFTTQVDNLILPCILFSCLALWEV
ncbi:unnamed protein product, partial [Hapterophycus canaliculatus]